MLLLSALAALGDALALLAALDPDLGQDGVRVAPTVHRAACRTLPGVPLSFGTTPGALTVPCTSSS